MSGFTGMRNWGYAPRYVEAMWSMLQQEQAEEYVIATGRSHSLREFVERVFAELDLDWERYVTFDASLRRPGEIRESRGDATRAERRLGWHHGVTFDELITRLVEGELALRA